jgi:ketosteroid isomerase-like protein
MKLPETLYELPRTLLGFHVQLVKQADKNNRSATIEDRLSRLEAERDIRTVINQYAYCYDEGDLDGLMDIYSHDCRLINNKGTFVGTDAIRANYADNISDRSFGYHHVSDVQIVLDDDGTAAWVSGFLYNLAVRNSVATGTMANCVFHLKVLGDSWKVVESRITVGNRHEFLPRQPVRDSIPSYATGSETVADLIDDLAQTSPLTTHQ